MDVSVMVCEGGIWDGMPAFWKWILILEDFGLVSYVVVAVL